MKKSTLLAICLSVSALANRGGVNSASAANASTSICAIDEDGSEGAEPTASVTSTKTDDGKTVTITVTGDCTSKSDLVSTIRTAIDGCTKVVVTGGGTITNAAVSGILFGEYAANTTVTTLDLGGVTVKDLSVAAFTSGQNYYMLNNLKVTDLTLPLAEKVTKEVDGQTIETMTVPSNIFCPSGQYYAPVYTTVRIPEGYTHIGDKAFENMSGIQNVVWPSTLTTIGKGAFAACTGITEFIAPANLTYIGAEAFCMAGSQSMNPSKIQFNDKLAYIGNSAFATNSNDGTQQQSTIVIPASVEYIGPFAFTGRTYTDVYYLGDQAPIEPMGYSTNSSLKNSGYGSSFDENVYMGNSTVDKTQAGLSGNVGTDGEANRLNYKDGQTLFTMLHFRADLTDDQKKTFTDITRVYKASGKAGTEGWKDEESLTDKPGKETPNDCLSYGGKYTAYTQVTTGYEDTYRGVKYVWPSQSQFQRSYVVNSLGLEWDGVTKYRPTITDKQKKYILNDGGNNISTLNLTDEQLADTLSEIAYLGTRRHVFLSPDVQGSSTDYEIGTDVTAKHWWTLCLPVSLTKKEVTDIFGEGTQVCLFSKVERDKGDNKKLHLFFQKDTYRNKYTKSTDGTYGVAGAATQDADTVITANEAYMIYPTKNPEGDQYVIKNYQPEAGSPLPTVVVSNADDNSEGADHTKYSFIGNRMSTAGDGTTMTIPQYCYFYAKKKGSTAGATNDGYQFWFYSGTTFPWKAGKCVVERYKLREGATDNTELFTTTSSGTEAAKQQSFFGFDSSENDPTAIEDVEFICGQDTVNAPIYNISGQSVGTSRSGLTKGLYIQNGKKFVVK